MLLHKKMEIQEDQVETHPEPNQQILGEIIQPFQSHSFQTKEESPKVFSETCEDENSNNPKDDVQVRRAEKVCYLKRT